MWAIFWRLSCLGSLRQHARELVSPLLLAIERQRIGQDDKHSPLVARPELALDRSALADSCCGKYADAMDVQLTERTRRILRRLQPATDLGESIEALTLDALRMRLRECVEQLGALEARYGCSFEDFAAEWAGGRVSDRRSHAIERDYMEWEALSTERRELLDLIRELTSSSVAAV